jgi:hypothetical protein
MELRELRAAGKPPRERVLTGAGPDDHDLHAARILR